MRVWIHKETGDLVLVQPAWEVPAGENMAPIVDEMPYRILLTAVCQTGWLIENGYGCGFWVSLDSHEYFHDVGEL